MIFTIDVLILKGIIIHPINDKNKESIGPTINRTVLAFVGNIISFTNSLKPSAIGCNKPKKPTTFGPLRLCMADNSFRSAKVNIAIHTSINTTVSRINNKIFIINIIFLIKSMLHASTQNKNQKLINKKMLMH